MAAPTPSRLQKFSGASIPQFLKRHKRWAPWHGEFNAKRGKWDKIPHRADRPEHRLSTAAPDKWFTFEQATEALMRNPEFFDGLGFVMTGCSGLVGIDLDGCVEQLPDGGQRIADWAQSIIESASSYTEISPSGRGLRIFLACEADGVDWDNNEIGIEVYGGSTARFLTVSGRKLAGTPDAVNAPPAQWLERLRSRFGGRTRAAVVDLPAMPEVLPAEECPLISEIDLPFAVRDFLVDGEHQGDRSRALHSAGVALYSAGLTDQQVLSILAASPYAMEVALDHRRQDTDRALAYLWEHHCVKARPKARVLDVGADFDGDAQTEDAVAGDDDFDTVATTATTTSTSTAKKPRFDIKTASDYLSSRGRLRWFVKGVLPQAEISAVFGASGSGKTFAVLDMMCRIALGLDWFGTPTRQSKVLYVAAEGASGLRDRIAAWCAFNEVEVGALDGKFFILGDQPNLMDRATTKELVACTRAVCGQVDLVVMDTMAQTSPGANENSGEDMGRYLAHCKAAGRALKASVVLIGHSGKDSDKGLRGWSGVKAALDAECEVVRTREYRALTVTKLKDGEGEGTEYRFGLKVVPLDFDAEDGVVSSCAVEAGEVLQGEAAHEAAQERRTQATGRAKKPVDGADRKLNKRQEVVLDFIRKEAGTRGREMDLDTLVRDISEVLAKDEREDVGVPTAIAHNRQTGWWLKERVLKQLEARGFISTQGSKILHVEGQVEF